MLSLEHAIEPVHFRCSLSFNSISDEGALHLAEALKRNFALKELILEHNNIGEEGAICLAQALTVNDTLEVFQ